MISIATSSSISSSSSSSLFRRLFTDSSGTGAATRSLSQLKNPILISSLKFCLFQVVVVWVARVAGEGTVARVVAKVAVVGIGVREDPGDGWIGWVHPEQR